MIKSEAELTNIVDNRVNASLLRERTRNAFIEACRGDVHTLIEELLSYYKDVCLEYDFMMSRVDRIGSEEKRLNAQQAIDVLEPVLRFLEVVNASEADGHPCARCGLAMKGPQLVEWTEPSGEPMNEMVWWCETCGKKEAYQ